jgi:protein-disulfide isomerase
MRFTSPSNKENAVAVLIALIKKLNIRVSSGTIQNCLNDHPDYPSLLALSDCLTEWKMPNSAYQIDKNEYDPADLSFPLIAHLQKSGQFILINSIANGRVIYTDGRKTNAAMPEQEFLSQWAGVVLYAEATPESGEKEYKVQRFKDILNGLRIPALVTAVFAGILYVFFQYSVTWVFTVLSIITLAGLIVSTLLLMYSVNASNPFVQNLCSLGKKNDCNAILKSKEAKVTGWLSWSEVGFFYFSGTLISLLLVNNAVPFLAVLNLCCLPYTFWSVWYQYKAKNWCVLCCTVQALLWLQFIVFAAGVGYAVPVPELKTIIALVISFSIPIVIWAFVKPFMLKAEQLAPLKQQLKKFKYNSDLFNQVLTNQPRFSVPNDIMPIVLGNAEAETVITMVSNPFCGPCATTHKILDQWLNTRNDIQVKIVFTTANHDDDPKTKVARHLTALSLLEDRSKVEQALNDWYDSTKKDYDTWAKNYPIHVNGEMEQVTQKQKEWCTLTEITFTPTILVNGYKLPDPYRLDDIKYLLG